MNNGENNNNDNSLMAMFGQESNNPEGAQPTPPVQQAPVQPAQPLVDVVTTPVPANGNQIPVDNGPVPSQNVNDSLEQNQELLKAFIGKNPSEFTNKAFNFGAFVFGPTYLFYRKMIALGFFFIIAEAFLTYLFQSAIVEGVVGLVITFTANHFYVNFAVNKIEKIKNNNPNATFDEIKEICRKKGGTSILIPILISVLTAVLMVALVYLYVFASLVVADDDNPVPSNVSTDPIAEYVTLENVPSKFKPVGDDDHYYSYYFDEGTQMNSNSCIALIEFTNVEISDETVKKYQGENGKVDMITENNIEWKHFNYDTIKTDTAGRNYRVRFHYYVSNINDKSLIFSLGYSGTNSEKCFDYEKEFLKSIHLAQ